MRRPAFAMSLALAGLVGAATAQSGPGLPKLVYEQDQLFKIIASVGTGNHGMALMHDGYLTLLRYGSDAVGFYDVSNPYRPRRVSTIQGGLGTLSEPHTVAQTTAYGGQHVVLLRGNSSLGGTGFGIWDWSDVLAPVKVRDYDVPGVPGGYASGLFWLFYQAPYVFCGAGSLGLYVVDASDPLNPFVAAHLPTSATGGFNAVDTLAVGNLLVLTNSDGGPGMALLDISDPTNPMLVHATTNTSIPYGLGLNGGGVLVPSVDGPVSGGGGGNGNYFEIRDPFEPAFPIRSQFVLPNRGGSALIQDGFAHVASSSRYVKIDLADLANPVAVGGTNQPNSGGDWDWVTPMGNLAVVGDDQGFGTHLIPHASLPDNTGPSVTMVVPADGATQQALSTRVGLTLSDMVEVLSLDPTTFFVRPVGGQPLAGSYSNQFGIVNFTPAQPLLADTTYEVVVPAGGVRDWSGNAAPTSFTSRFSTGGAVTAIDVTAVRTAPSEPGESVTFDVASVTGPGPFQYSWDFGDGTPPTPLSTVSQAMHAYTEPAHRAVVVTVTNGSIQGSDSYLQIVHRPLTPARPTRSSSIALDPDQGRVWCVNADNDSVTAIDTATLTKALEVPVGRDPRSLAEAPDGTLWVVCRGDATIRVLEPLAGGTLATIPLPYASAPFGVAMSPDGSAAYVTLGATGELAKLDPASRSLLGTAPVGPDPRGIAIAADSERVFVTRFRSSPAPSPLSLRSGRAAGGPFRELQPGPWSGPRPTPVAEVYEVSATSFARVRRLALHMDPGPDTETSGRGLPNYLSAPTVSPDGARLWLPSKKDNIERGLFRSGEALTTDNTVRTIASQVDLASNAEVLSERIDFNDRDMAFAAELSPLGDYVFFVLQGSNALDVRDAYTGALVAGIDGTGLAPQGLVMTADGATLYVHNFLSRTVSAYDVSGVTAATQFALPHLGEVSTVAAEQLSPDVLAGKQLFYDASDRRMNNHGYLSCASCHLDGDDDGQTWDFTDRGEGVRNTISLVGRAGGQGNLHWTANFDEVQDFENDIRNAFGGAGFLPDAVFFGGTVQNPLGQPKAGLSPELDALAAYVASLSEAGLSPHRNPDGSLTAAALNGKAVFAQLGCAQCHSGPAFTDSATGALHDVGTLTPASGQAIGGPLVGLDTPTLRGLWATAPYLHDGSAPTLLDVLTTRNPLGQHGATPALTAQERSELVAYLLQIDDLEREPGSE